MFFFKSPGNSGPALPAIAPNFSSQNSRTRIAPLSVMNRTAPPTSSGKMRKPFVIGSGSLAKKAMCSFSEITPFSEIALLVARSRT